MNKKIVYKRSKRVLILHGWGSSKANWEDFLSEASAVGLDCVFLELPGFGKTPPPLRAWTVDDYKNYCKKYVASLKDKPDFLLAHSFGARIAIKWLSEKGTSDFKGALLVGAAGIRPELSFIKKIIGWLAGHLSFLKFSLARKILHKILGSSDYTELKGTMKQTFTNVVSEDLTSLLGEIKVPVKLVWGALDTYTPLWMGKKMQKLIPNTDLVIIKDAKHGIHMQKPEKLATIAKEFFASL